MVTHSLRGEGFDASEDGTGRGTPLVAASLTAGVSSDGISAPGRRQEDDENIVAFTQNQREEVRELEVAGALAAEPGMKQTTYLAFKQGQGSKAGGLGESEHVAPTLGAADSGTNRTPALMHGMAVRRLTPLECTRLQGFPDDYFDDVPGRSDSAVYKALGNSMAVPVMEWIGRRVAVLERQ